MSMWCLHDVSLISIWWLYDVYTMPIWCLYDVCMIAIWCLYDGYMMSMWCLYDVYIIAIWCLYDVYMVFMILQCQAWICFVLLHDFDDFAMSSLNSLCFSTWFWWFCNVKLEFALFYYMILMISGPPLGGWRSSSSQCGAVVYGQLLHLAQPGQIANTLRLTGIASGDCWLVGIHVPSAPPCRPQLVHN